MANLQWPFLSHCEQRAEVYSECHAAHAHICETFSGQSIREAYFWFIIVSLKNIVCLAGEMKMIGVRVQFSVVKGRPGFCKVINNLFLSDFKKRPVCKAQALLRSCHFGLPWRYLKNWKRKEKQVYRNQFCVLLENHFSKRRISLLCCWPGHT